MPRGNQGWSTGSAGNRGPKPLPGGPRQQHQVRAYADEWALIKEFTAIVKKDFAVAKKIIDSLK